MASVTMESFLRSFGSNIEEPVRVHLKNVYSCLAMCTLAAAAGAYIHLFTNLLQGSFITSFIALGFLMVLIATPDDGKNRSMRMFFLLGFASTTGLGLGPLLDMVIMINPGIIATGFLATSIIFICFSASAILSQRGQWLYLGGTLLSLLGMMILMTIANLLFGSRLLFQVNLYLGLLVMCGFILYDTQMIMEKRRLGDKDYIRHSVDLFIDFVNIFRRLLIILSQKEQSKKNRKD